MARTPGRARATIAASADIGTATAPQPITAIGSGRQSALPQTARTTVSRTGAQYSMPSTMAATTMSHSAPSPGHPPAAAGPATGPAGPARLAGLAAPATG